MSGRKPTFTKTDFTTYQDICIVDQSINGTEPNATIAKTLPTDWAYLGCNHGTTYSDVFVKIWGGDGLSLGRCAEHCTGEEYFGVKNGSE
ncbi:MAG: hypothetical protein Q9205_005962 [Flavoplaca limonia]